MPSRQGFKTVDRLRLEIGAPPASGQRNLIRNPSGERGAWGWHVTTGDLRIQSNRTSANYRPGGTLTATTVATKAPSVVTEFESEAWACAPGQYVGASFRLVTAASSGTTVSYRVVFRDAAGQQIGTGSPANTGTAGSKYGVPIALAPAGTSSAHLRFTLTNGGTAVRSFSFREAMLVVGNASSEVTGTGGSPDFVEPLTWTDVLAPALNIETDRSALGLGILSARIRSASLDPAVSTLVRPGRPIRLMAYSASSLDWEPIFWGKIQDGKTSYDQDYPVASKRALIVLTAVDAADELANTSMPQSHRQIRMLGDKMRSTGVPYVLDGSTDNYQSVNPVLAVNENASVLDQIALTRDTTRSYAAVTRHGVMRAIDRQYMNGIDNQTSSPSDPLMATFDPADYNADAVIDFDTKRLVNTVLIQCRYIKEDGTTTDGVFGPYVDPKSVQEWGAFQRTYTIAGVEDSASLAFRAAEVLQETATPVRRLTELTFPVASYPGDFYDGTTSNRRVHLDLLDRVTVNNPLAGISGVQRVAGIKHIIQPEKWLVRLSFDSEAGTPAPRTQAAIPVGQSQLLPDTPWVNVPLEGGYTHFDASAPVQYRRKDGVVYLRGLLGGGAANGNTAFTLPPGFRGGWQRGNMHWQITRSDVPMLCRTWTNGAVQPTVAGGYIDVGPISYLAEN